MLASSSAADLDWAHCRDILYNSKSDFWQRLDDFCLENNDSLELQFFRDYTFQQIGLMQGFVQGLRWKELLHSSPDSPLFQLCTQLSLSFQRLQARDIQELARWKNLCYLRELSLLNNSVGDRGAVAIARSKNFQNLRLLDLSNNSISDDGLKAIARSNNLEQLEHLILVDNAITDEGVVALAKSRSLPNLKEVNLEYNTVTENALCLFRDNELFADTKIFVYSPVFEGVGMLY